MPLSEFFKLARENLESAKQKEAAGSTDLPTGQDNQLADLSLGNDQIAVQGHSARSTTSLYNEQFSNFGFQNSVLGNTSYSILEGTEAFNDFRVGIGQDDGMATWLSYPIHDSLQKDHSNLLTELPPVPLNDSTKRNLSRDKMRSRSGQFQSLPFESGSEIISTGHIDVTKTRALVFPSIRIPNQDSEIANSNSGFENFSHFNPSSSDRGNVPCLTAMPSLGTFVTNPSGIPKDMYTPDQPILGPLKDSPRPVATMPHEGLGTAENSQENTDKGKRVIEPLVASTSVSSGNSVEGDSDNPTQSLKRKSRESDEVEGLCEDLQDEFADAGKSGATKGSKRGRAAEVHNLSERRRREKINEKMCALQELIPNCNKADKASMLDEAIEYLKTLQLQLQIMSMGAGLCVPPMMLTPQMQQMQAARMPFFAPTSMAMGMGLGHGTGPMARVPLGQGAYLPGPSLRPPVAGPLSFQLMVGPNFSNLWHTPHVNTSHVDINANAMAVSHFNAPSNTNDLGQNDDTQLMGNAEAGPEKPKVIQGQPTVKGCRESKSGGYT